jgi:hypothetical protein
MASILAYLSSNRTPFFVEISNAICFGILFLLSAVKKKKLNYLISYQINKKSVGLLHLPILIQLKIFCVTPSSFDKRYFCRTSEVGVVLDK